MKGLMSWWRASLAVVAAMMLALASVTPASAQVSGGNGGAGGVDGSIDPYYWAAWSGPNAWANFSQMQGFADNYSTTGQRLGWSAISMSDQDRANCMKSNVIWYLTSTIYNGGYWYSYAYDYGQDTIYAFNNGGRDIRNPQMRTGNLADAQKYNDAVAQWNSGRNSMQRASTVVVCSAGFEQTRQIVVPDYKSDSSSTTVTGVYSLNTTLTPQFASNRPLEAQAGSPTKTNFGKLFDQYFTVSVDPKNMTYTVSPRGNTILPDDLVAQADAAKAADASIGHGTVDLSEKNKAGMADGGVLNVNEYQQTVSFTASKSDTYRRQQTCNQTSNDGGVTWITTSCDPWTDWSLYTSGVGVPSGTLPVQAQTGFWQMLSVHCNDQGFNDLMAKTAGTVISSGDPTLKLAASANSKKYVTQPAVLDFGQPGTPSGGKAFYDKECPFDCTNAVGPDATAANGADSNSGNNKPTTDPKATVDKYGAVSGNNNTNKFEFFRDNKPNSIKLDVWYPKDGGVVSYNGAAPLTTTITRWVAGTPSIDGSSGGKFTFKTGDGRDVFTTGGSIKNQKNWDPTVQSSPGDYEFSTPTAALFKGLVRNFTAQSTWATDEITLANGKKVLASQVLNFKWEYAPNVSNNIPTTGVGFGPTGSQVIGTIGTVTAPIQGKCYAQFGTDTPTDVSTQVRDNTGSGTTNKLDTQLLNYDPSDRPADNANNLFITFVRSTGE